MSYQAYKIAGLHGRDFLFFLKYQRNKLLNRMKQKKPLIICNSYPKSGTHLLYQILYSIEGLNKWEDIVSVQSLCGIMNTASHIRWKIGSAPKNSIIRSHLMYCEEILDILQQENCKTLFIYRDLRDVAVSHANWVTKEERIFLHNIYSQYSSFDEKLMNTIKGVPVGTPFGSNVSQPDIGQDFLRWKGWIGDSKTLALKFEDLVGERGNGSEEVRLNLIEKIINHLEINQSFQLTKSKFASNLMNPTESHTYVKGGKGKIGRWKDFFNERHKFVFKNVAGEILIDLGYEKDLSW